MVPNQKNDVSDVLLVQRELEQEVPALLHVHRAQPHALRGQQVAALRELQAEVVRPRHRMRAAR
eukprot:292024-Rhodomonas_salina.1